ncbi:MAG: hypothetical protein MJA83_09655, partial [Gammaproteobacteria bacterium]|nr:hypothetical protein [Gammaproteobacteria bacterium]
MSINSKSVLVGQVASACLILQEVREELYKASLSPSDKDVLGAANAAWETANKLLRNLGFSSITSSLDDKNVEPSTYLKALIKEFIENWTPAEDETIFSQDELEFEIQPKLLKEH